LADQSLLLIYPQLWKSKTADLPVSKEKTEKVVAEMLCHSDTYRLYQHKKDVNT